MPFVYDTKIEKEEEEVEAKTPCCAADAATKSGPCCDPATGQTTADRSKLCCDDAGKESANKKSSSCCG